jgi:lipopolysaccharide heptosyltransferase II
MFHEMARIRRWGKGARGKRLAVAIIHLTLWPVLLIPRLFWPRRKGAALSRILLIRVDGIGDLAMSLAIFPALRRRFPNAQIDLLTSSAARPIAEMLVGAGWINYVHVMPLLARSPRVYLAMAHKLRYDAGVDLRGDIRNVMLLWLAGAPRRIGLAGSGLRYLLTGVVDLPEPHHQADEVAELVRQLGVELSGEGPHLPLQPDHVVAAQQWLAAHGARPRRPICALHLGAFQPCKAWPLDRFIALARRLREEGDMQVLIVGGPEETRLAEALALEVGGPVMIAVGQTSLAVSAALLSFCSVFVGNDSGPAHLAAVAGCPVVVLFGPANPAVYRPRGAHVKVMSPSNACDRRCDKVCARPQAPCMLEHTVSAVLLEATRIMRSPPQWDSESPVRPALRS